MSSILFVSWHPFNVQLKLKNMVTTQQEKLLGEKEMVIERQKHELQNLNDNLAKKQDEVQTHRDSVCVACMGEKSEGGRREGERERVQSSLFLLLVHISVQCF